MRQKQKTLYNKDGRIVGYTSRPRLIDKYWHRIKMMLKKEHKQYCACYWCLKERFTSDTICPKCKKRKLKMSGYHVNYGPNKPHESGVRYYCKCGYKLDED